ncbi:erythrocyte membrane protein 1 [Plasmodium falciparum NF54]|uniref:Erythrocyte membrane protein 1, PfEMP1 n=2 Tax=Plasmodium falciparum TaxID=5833 RepID=Q8I1V7_PLAF7|nr:erythrocyte membrane protein 1, PfEMP1 [Plasmodium falciparum 3D7]KAF4329981.1 erythrocyte membrane protein 1 [Plasmodium falciparum NF54]CAD49166.1 erythrocyte membrane protein 1, PfEMP1 [Plasmodium falciparum 3D7]|eukprot:XP_001351438.1 erythrocyte membrane protein 1, PfEMP1 [Plasmodium falciparum 3D7]
MGPPSTAPDYSSAKHALDSIGKRVHAQVQNEAKQRSNGDLKGLLTSATLSGGESAFTENPCELIKDKGDELLGDSGERHPCGNGSASEKRFSEVSGGECDDKKIEGNGRNNGGACAPYRRLFLCNKNMEKMGRTSTTKHDLLLDVCMAANYEAQSLIRYHDQYDATYPGSDFSMCTMLARSFADIGDIIRGKDLYLGKKKKKKTETERDQLESKLKKIFGDIYNELTNGRNGVKDHYQDDNGGNYFQLREDWWTANRATVWKAITCKADTGNAYFRPTCSNRQGPSQAHHYCRCNGDKPDDDKPNTDPPTYFDYVPQYLRWFEEWAEDFCRKKKIYVGIVKTYCREKYKSGNEPRYCSRNGYDCTKTKRAIGKYRMGNQCISCLYACNPYVDWINNQKEQFDKQKKKYTDEINEASRSSRRQKRGARSTGSSSNYDGYESKFYNILKDDYGTVDDFLKLLNKEKSCQAVKDNDGGTINFTEKNDDKNNNNKDKGTFYRSEYCQVCPDCGVKYNGSGWEEKKKNDQCNIKLYKPKKDAPHTPIKILKSGEGKEEIEKKLEAFCDKKDGGNSDSSLYDPWQCYQFDQLEKDEKEEGVDDRNYDNDVRTGGGLCILQKKNGEENGKKQKTYNDFFNFWVAHMLKDSIHWKKKLEKCLQNGTKTRCRNNEKCNKECECFQRWVEKKKTEWGKIKDHFKTQNIGDETNCDPIVTLEGVLKLQFLNEDSTQDKQNSLDSEELKHLKHLSEMLQETSGDGLTCGASDNEKETLMDKLIEHEEGIAKECLRKQNECEKKAKPEGRSDSHDDPQPPDDADNEDDLDDEDDEDEEEEVQVEDNTQEEGEQPVVPQQEEGSSSPTPAPAGPDVCDIVSQLFSDPSQFSDACTLKYVTGKNYGWKCIPSGNTSDTTGSESEATGARQRRDTDSSGDTTGGKDGATGGLCIPPRRRRLYVGGLSQWASQRTQGETSSQSGENLLEAFIQSAAIETFFLWHKYKAENTKTQGVGAGGADFLPATSSVATALAPGAVPSRPSLQLLSGVGVPGEPGMAPGVKSIPVPPLGVGVGGIPGVGALGGGALGPGGPVGLDGVPGQAQPLTLLRPGVLGNGLQSPQSRLRTLDGHFAGGESEDKTPQQWLQQGHIPPDFLRLMFYTLADYRDICIGGDRDIVGDTIVSNTEGSSSSKIKISEKIKEILNHDNKQEPAPKPSVEKTTPTEWWSQNGQHIWNGMICALTYTDSGGSITEDKDVRDKLIDKDTGKPQKNGDNDYTYEKVELKDDESGPKGNDTIQPATLKDFVEIPTYFRWLHEWGSDFCGKRARMLKDVKDNCRNIDKAGHHYCSGDGYDCTRDVIERNDKFVDLNCLGCYKQCRKYKKWIDIKFVEYHNQEKKYKDEYGKLTKDKSSDDKKLEGYKCAENFLKELKHCKPSEDNNDQDNKINFDKPEKTFNPSKYCKACPVYGVKYIGGNYIPNEEKDYKSKKGRVKKENDTIPKNIEVLVLGRKGEEKDKDKHLHDACKNTGLFEVARYEQWNCQKKKGIDQCKITKFANDIDFDKDIVFNEFFQRWLRYFVQDYNKLKDKINPCTKKETEKEKEKSYKCTQGCNDKCECVKEWLSKKKQEWTQIKTLYKQYSKISDQEIAFRVKSYFVDQGLFDNDYKKAQEVVEKPCDKEKLWGCTGDNLKEGEDPGKCHMGDFITNLISKLQKKIDDCNKNQAQNSVETQPSDENTAQCQDTHPDDEEDLLLEENENQVAQPNICPNQVEDKKIEEEVEKCETAQTTAEETAAAGGERQTPPAPAPAAPPSPPRPLPKPKPPKPDLPPALKNAMLSSTIMWSVGIGFAAFTYFFLKKKTKASVGNLFQILQIPKGDYDIPTLKSSNRYIPYASDRYKGKTYIYMEGDSSGDEKYAFMSDTTDVTSSESEYEELDVNDIYVPGSPKYKTLIEVVLEPSGNNTPTSDIPSDNTPTPQPITDDEWNQLKHDFISNMLQNTQNTEPNILHDNVDNNTHPTMSRHNMDQKPFIMSIHDRNLFSGEEYNYDMFNSGNNPINISDSTNSMDSLTSNNHSPYNDKNDLYSGIDLINDALSGNHIDIYDEMLKRKENELFGTQHHPKNITSNRVVTQTSSDDPIHNQLNLFHTWLDRHRDMCEKLKNDNERLAKLKEEWENETHSGDINSGIPSGNHVLNTDVSIQIHMDNPKPINEFTNMDTSPDKSTMDTIIDDLEKYNEPYYYDFYEYDIYYDVNDDDKTSMDNNNNLVNKNNPVDSNSSTYNHHNPADINKTFVDINNHNQHPIEKPTKIQIEMNSNNREVDEQQYPIADIWNI